MLSPASFRQYELIDHGEIRKLERFGSVITDRPEPSAIWGRDKSFSEWDNAGLLFSESGNGEEGWNREVDESEEWLLTYTLDSVQMKLSLKTSTSKHIGVFPEQAVNWDFIYKRCQQIGKTTPSFKVLNLFAYTGAASLAASLGGASVTHVDSSASVINWAKRNAEINDISTIRWIVEDARKFVEKCIRRGEIYQGIIMDPPVFGLARKGQSWKLNRDLAPLLTNVMKIMDPHSSFFVLNTYSPQLPMNKLKQVLSTVTLFPKYYESHMLGLVSRSNKKLPLGNLIRFST